MKCKKFRKEIPDGSKFCNHCGAKQEKQIRGFALWFACKKYKVEICTQVQISFLYLLLGAIATLSYKVRRRLRTRAFCVHFPSSF